MHALCAALLAVVTPKPVLNSLSLQSLKGVIAPTRPATTPIHVKIDGSWYDVTAWADSHPGGRYVLEWADGYDITGAFHTIHLFSSAKSTNILERMPIADLSERAEPPPNLPLIDNVPEMEQTRTGMDNFMKKGEDVIRLASPPATSLPSEVPVRSAAGLAWQQPHDPTVGQSALKRDLEELLHSHFDSPADYKATPEHWLRIAGAFALLIYCLAGWSHGSLPETLLLPFAQWLLFSPTVHESSHSTLSTKPEVNYAAAFCGLPYIYNPFIWWPQHIISHHQFTNDDALDVDLHHLRPARLHPGSEPEEGSTGFNFIFKGYFSTIGMAVLWPLRNLQKKSTGRWYENLITPKPDAVSESALLLSMLPTAFVLIWPWLLVLAHLITVDLLHGAYGSYGVSLPHGTMLWLYPWMVSGAIWTVMTQVSHVQEDCQRPPTGDADDYFRWQIESAIDYSVHSELVPKLTATLNLQSMHHVMPSVCGCHFHKLYPEYKAICERHNVRHNTRKDLSDAWRTAIGRVFELSSPEATPEWTAEEEAGEKASLWEHAPLVGYLGLPVATLLVSSVFF